MDLKLDLFRSLRGYVFDFGSGLVWLIALVLLWFCFGALPWPWPEFVALLKQAESSKFLQVLLVAGGIILPFVVSVALKPIALMVMNFTLILHRVVQLPRPKKWRANVDVIAARLAENELVVLQKTAHAQLQNHLGYHNSLSQEVVLAFIQKKDPVLAEWLGSAREDIWFRSSLVMPTAVLIGAALQMGFQLLWLSCVAGVLAFLITSTGAARGWRSWHEKLNASVLVIFGK